MRCKGDTPSESVFAFRELMHNETVRRHFISDVLDIPLEEIPDDIRSCINIGEDAEILRGWLKAAAKATCFDDFRVRMN